LRLASRESRPASRAPRCATIKGATQCETRRFSRRGHALGGGGAPHRRRGFSRSRLRAAAAEVQRGWPRADILGGFGDARGDASDDRDKRHPLARGPSRVTVPLIILWPTAFPECWYSWRHQLPALANAGFRAVGPPTCVAMGEATIRRRWRSIRFSMTSATSWVSSTLLGAEQAVIAGHDVGATMAWQSGAFCAPTASGPLSAPQRAVPGRGGLAARWPADDAHCRGTRMQCSTSSSSRTPEAEAALGRDMRRTFRSQLYSLSGDRSPSAGGGFADGDGASEE